MQFIKQTITILQPGHIPAEVEAMVGEDSGLGYYRHENGYIVTTTQSGYYVANLEYCEDLFQPDEALNDQMVQHFIEIIAPWLDWNKSKEEVEAQAAYCFGGKSVYSHLYKAWNEAYQQVIAVKTSN